MIGNCFTRALNKLFAGKYVYRCRMTKKEFGDLKRKYDGDKSVNVIFNRYIGNLWEVVLYRDEKDEYGDEDLKLYKIAEYNGDRCIFRFCQEFKDIIKLDEKFVIEKL